MGDFWWAVGVLLRKELLMILKDKRSRIILVMPIIVQTILFGYVATYDLNCVEYALLDEDHSQASRELVRAFVGAGIFKQVLTLNNSLEIAPALESKKALLVVHLKSDFEKLLNAGAKAPVQILVDGRNSNVAGIAQSYAAVIIERFNSQRLKDKGLNLSASSLTSRAWFNPNLETRWGIISALTAVLSVIQVLSIAGQSIAREKEQGTFDQLLVTPFDPLIILFGKAIPPILIGLLQSSLILMVALWHFKIPMAGSIGWLYGSLLFFNCAVVGIGLTVSCYSKNMQQAMLYNFTLLMPMILLSGFATPISSMPKFFQLATLVNPVRYGVELTQRIYLEGAGFMQIWPLLGALMLMTIVTLGAALKLFSSKLT